MGSSEAGMIDRRRFLTRGLLAGAGLVAAPSLLAACSNSGASATVSTAPATAAASASAPASAAASVASSASAAASVAASASAAAGFGTPNTKTSLKDFSPFAPSTTVGQKPPVPSSFAYFVPAANEYFKGLSDAAAIAAKERKIDYQGLIIDGGDPVKNIDQMNQALQKKIGALWIQPSDSKAQAVVIEKAIEQGLCTEFAGNPSVIQGMADQYDIGYTQAIATVKWIKENLGGKATVVNFTLDYIPILIPRHQGATDGLATGGPDVKVIEQAANTTTSDEAFGFASTLMQVHPDINVWNIYDDAALGVDAYLKSKGHDPNKEKIMISGLNGTDAVSQAILSGKSFIRQATAFNSNLIGYAIGQYFADWFEGKRIPQVLQGRAISLNGPDDVTKFLDLIKDPAATFKKYAAGDYESYGLAAWGDISYDTHMNYTANAVTG